MTSSIAFRLRSAVFAAVLIGVSLPGLALAQTSGNTPPPGIVRPRQLPNTGMAATDARGLPAMLLGGGALVAGLALRGRGRRRRQ